MKYYFFTHNRLQNFKLVGTYNDVSIRHPINVVIDWNKQINDKGESPVFYTLLFFTEISKDDYDYYKANEKYI